MEEGTGCEFEESPTGLWQGKGVLLRRGTKGDLTLAHRSPAVTLGGPKGLLLS